MDEEKDKISQNVDEKISESSTQINEVKDEGKKFFNINIRTSTKWILAISIILFLLCGILVYASIYAGLEVEIWQAAIWGLCVPLSIYAIVMRSVAAIIFELILFFGVSLIPAWQMGYEYFRPVIERIIG
ncbi:MAG: hypothetical protein IKZ58_02365 [Selenomonadaceae bacterium]|nr:hypothetical protein [Selenomonadaceae bacterium]